MNVITKQVKIKRSIINEEIETSLKEYGNPIRWAVVRATEDKFIVEGVFFQE